MRFSRGYIVLFALALLCAGCGYDSHDGCDVRPSEAVPNFHFSQFATYADKGTTLPEGCVVQGVVIANDISGNFYQTLVVESEGVAVEVRLDLYDLHALYPVGSIITIRCGGLAVTRHWGCLSLGRAVYGWSGGTLEPIAPRSEVLRRVEVVRLGAEPEAFLCHLGELSRERCGELVQIEGLSHKGEPEEWAVSEYVSEIDHTFEDSEGREVVIRTSRYADFAAERIPLGKFGARGILYAIESGDQEVWIIKFRDCNDIIE